MADRARFLLACFLLLVSGSLAFAEGNGTNSTQAPLPSVDLGWGGYFQALATVFLLLAILVVAFWLVRRYLPIGSSLSSRGLLRLESQLALGPRRHVVVVRFLNKRLVLGVTESHINLLHETDADHETNAATFDTTFRTQRDAAPADAPAPDGGGG